MPKIVVEEQKEFTLLPKDSILHLKVDELTVREVDGRHGKWHKLEFKFKILGIQAAGDGSPVEQFEDVIAGPIWGSVPFKLTDSPENKLRQWAEAILGIELGIGFELDTDIFLGRECRGITSQYEKKAKDSQGNPLRSHQVDSLLPKAGGAPTPQPQVQQQMIAAATQDPWATPGVQQPQVQQQPAPQQDPWGTPPGGWSDEPPF